METDSSMRAAANIREKILRRHRKNEDGEAIVKVQGQSTSLSLQCENELSLMLIIKAKWGFAYGFDTWGNIKTEVPPFT